jgi:hypothetical protein
LSAISRYGLGAATASARITTKAWMRASSSALAHISKHCLNNLRPSFGKPAVFTQLTFYINPHFAAATDK